MEKVFNRRSVLKGIGSTSAALVPLALSASGTKATEIDQDRFTDQLISIAEQTGLSLSDLYAWFKGSDLTQVVENVSNWREKDTRTLIEIQYRNFEMAMTQFAEEKGAETWSVNCCGGKSISTNLNSGGCSIKLGINEIDEQRKPEVVYSYRSVDGYRFYGHYPWNVSTMRGIS